MTTITKQAAIEAIEAQKASFASNEYAVGQPLSSFAERFACDQIAAAINALPAVTVTDDVVWEGKVAYETELKAWRVVPDLASQYNDRGTIKYKHVWVTDDMREADLNKPVSGIPETSTFKRIHLKTETAKEYIAWHAMKVALEAALTPQ